MCIPNFARLSGELKTLFAECPGFLELLEVEVAVAESNVAIGKITRSLDLIHDLFDHLDRRDGLAHQKRVVSKIAADRHRRETFLSIVAERCDQVEGLLETLDRFDELRIGFVDDAELV